MRLDELVGDLPIEVERGAPDLVVGALADDSRRVGPAALFVARPGTADDGRRYVDDAVSRGAVAILSDRSVRVEAPHVACLRAVDVARCAAVLAERFHGEPSRRLAVVGVTGTNGKTTVAALVRRLLVSAGLPCGSIGTVGIDLGGRGADAACAPSPLTTPSALELSALLARMVDRGCHACVMEASSHALDQGRTAGLTFAGGIFTNLSGDHLDYHGTMARYAEAKAELFTAISRDGWAIVNADDPAAETIIARCAARVVPTSLTDGDAMCSAEVGALGMTGTACVLRGPWGVIETTLPLVGRHNVANALQAAAAGHELGLDADALRRGLGACRAPEGRLEPVAADGEPGRAASEVDPKVFIDYAHTDDALDNVLRGLRPIVPDGRRLVVVFGCGGDRDRTKRPRMAAAAWRWADAVTVTSDNPRTEDPARIIDDVIRGVPAEHLAETVRTVDRADAIRSAITNAGAGDIVVIAGKGHETYQIIGTERRPFDDRLIARSALNARVGGAASWTTTPGTAGRSV